MIVPSEDARTGRSDPPGFYSSTRPPRYPQRLRSPLLPPPLRPPRFLPRPPRWRLLPCSGVRWNRSRPPCTANRGSRTGRSVSSPSPSIAQSQSPAPRGKRRYSSRRRRPAAPPRRSCRAGSGSIRHRTTTSGGTLSPGSMRPCTPGCRTGRWRRRTRLPGSYENGCTGSVR